MGTPMSQSRPSCISVEGGYWIILPTGPRVFIPKTPLQNFSIRSISTLPPPIPTAFISAPSTSLLYDLSTAGSDFSAGITEQLPQPCPNVTGYNEVVVDGYHNLGSANLSDMFNYNAQLPFMPNI